MNSKVFQSGISNLMSENRLLKFCLVVVAIATVINSFQIHRAMSLQRTIVLPPAVKEKFEVSGDSVSESYIRMMADHALYLAFTYTASNARGHFEELLGMYEPDAYTDAKKMFYDLADKIEGSAKVTSVFYPAKYVVYEDSKKIEVSGLRRIYSENSKIEDDQKSYAIEYGVRDGRFVIYKLYEKPIGGSGKNA